MVALTAVASSALLQRPWLLPTQFCQRRIVPSSDPDCSGRSGLDQSDLCRTLGETEEEAEGGDDDLDVPIYTMYGCTSCSN